MSALTTIFSKVNTAIRKKIENSFVVKKISSYPLGNRILNDIFFRAKVSLNLGLLINLTYGAVQFFTSLRYHSVWIGSLAIYHILLAAIRFLLLRYAGKNAVGENQKAELRQTRLCGIALLLMTPVFAGILILVVHKNNHAGYSGILIYIVAIYTFCKIGIAISNTIKFKKYGSPVMCAAKDVSLIAALISILTLETAVLSRYGNMQNPAFYQGMLGTVGGSICMFTLGKAFFMITHATKQLRNDYGV
ncbi:MAG: hypothetical protein ACI4BB_02665 [Coprococcus sp.]